MQKKIIALAVAGLVSGAAYAQVAPNNVTLYGIIDMGFQYSTNNYADHTKAKSEMKSGGWDGSRVGVKGEEDLGNGLKAGFDATWNFGSDYNSPVQMGEGSSVYLDGSFGKIRAGYFGNFLDDNSGVDASGRHGVANTGALYDTGKYENFVAYYSPSFNGLQFKAGFSSNVGGQDKTPYAWNTNGNTGGYSQLNLRAYTAAVSYENGPIKAGVAYAKYSPQDVNNAPSTKDGEDWNAGASYDFGVARVSLFGSHQKAGSVATPFSQVSTAGGFSRANDFDSKNFLALGLSAPIGANDAVTVGYGQAKTKYISDKNDDDAKAFGLLYYHTLSKRTLVYAMYGHVSSDDELYSVTSGYKSAFNVGVKHTF